uniref:Cullin neddylation domain-containing protein n=1 Tax=Palpitomonas bilix TaxID=652834 RepID=A0A7S3D0B3_9EUKA|mmetsp:Transcript_16898/g.42424  ORF Transcript_16898/g.42424 Transcript_16898/m.42424 type:complete len:116 (+) Transcript_16898:40-387(+)
MGWTEGVDLSTLTVLHRMRRFRVPTARKRISKDERNQAEETVENERKFATDAAIVRVMKARKTCSLQELIGEVSSQLMSLFRADTRSVKRRIEDLVAREFLERDSKDSSLFNYLA